MNAGMLWQEQAPLAERVEHAVTYFQKKYGHMPNTAFVSACLLTEEQMEVGSAKVNGVNVRPMRLPLSLLWIGVEDAAEGIERKSEQLLEQTESQQLPIQMEMAL